MNKPRRCFFGFHRWREMPRSFRLFAPRLFECSLCGKREWGDS